MTYEARLPQPEPLPIKKSTKRHLYISDDCVRRVNKILDERRNPPEPKPKEIIVNNPVHPHNLLPIHLSREPISVDYQTVSLLNPQIKKRHIQGSSNKRPPSTSRSDSNRPRKKHKFVDDSAIESDGDGGDVLSTATSPASTPPSTPVRVANSSAPNKTSSITLSHTPAKVYRIRKVPDPDKWCELCTLKLTSKEQLHKHLNGKKHKKAVLIFKSKNPENYCDTCNRAFDNYKNYSLHKCKLSKK